MFGSHIHYIGEGKMDDRKGRALIILLCALTMAACSSGGGSSSGGNGAQKPIDVTDGSAGGEDSGGGESPSDVEHGEVAQEVAEIAGVWDISADFEENGITAYDEAFIVIEEVGIYSEYDYLGDEFAVDPQNCYEQRAYGTIEALGDGRFELYVAHDGLAPFEYENRYSVEGDTLFVSQLLFSPAEEVVEVPRAEQSLEEIRSMLCEE